MPVIPRFKLLVEHSMHFAQEASETRPRLFYTIIHLLADHPCLKQPFLITTTTTMINQPLARVALMLLMLLGALASCATSSPLVSTATVTPNAVSTPTQSVKTTGPSVTTTPATAAPLRPVAVQLPGVSIKPAIPAGVLDSLPEDLTAAGGGRPIPQRAQIVQGVRRWCCRDRFRCVQVRCGRSIQVGTYLFGGRYATLSQCVAGLCSKQCYITRLQRCPEAPAF